MRGCREKRAAHLFWFRATKKSCYPLAALGLSLVGMLTHIALTSALDAGGSLQHP